jgi:hypothetical protein
MKRHIWENAVVAVSLPIIVAGFTIFGFGGWPIPDFSDVIAAIFFMFFMLSYIVIIYLILSDSIFILKKWKEYHSRTLIPFLLLAAGISVSFSVSGFSYLYIEYRFEKYLPQYEEVVQLMQDGLIETDKRIILPNKYKHLAYLAGGYKDSENVFTVEFWVGGINRMLYIYRSNGILEDKNDIDVHSIRRLKEHWFSAVK